MIKLKGVYEWKLIDINTRKTIDSGTQENLITDNGLNRLLNINGATNSDLGNPWRSGSSSTGRIFISTTIPDANIDYRLTAFSTNGLSVTNSSQTTNLTRTGTVFQGEVNFNPPVSPTIVRVIGLLSSDVSPLDLISFIELTTPITQQTTQFLFVRYRVEASYTGAGTNGVINPFVTTRVNNYLLASMVFNETIMKLTQFKKPIDLTLCGRPVSPDNTIDTLSINTRLRENLSYRFTDSYTISEVTGVHSSSQLCFPSSGQGITGGIVFAVPQYPTTPTVSTVFAHAVADDSIFSNPGNPPLSRGNVLVTGTSSASHIFKKISLNITQTGEANNIPNVNTGKYKYGVNTFSNLNLDHVCPLELGGNSLYDINWSDGQIVNSFRIAMQNLFWSQYAPNGFMYFSQEYSSIKYLCKWRFNTLESAEEVVQLDSNVAIIVGNYLWIATNTGLIKFDTTTDTISDTFTAVDGLLNDTCTDIAYDDVTNILWIGHITGLTKFNLTSELGTNTYTTATSPFTTLTANQIRVWKGQLSARSGFVCRGGSALQANSDDVESPWIFDNNTNTLVRIPKSNFTDSKCGAVTLIGDGTGNIIVDSTTNNAVAGGKIAKWNVVPNTSSFSLSQSTTYSTSAGQSSGTVALKLIRISSNQFMIVIVTGLDFNFSDDYIMTSDYNVLTNVARTAETVGVASLGNGLGVNSAQNRYANVSKIDVDGVTMAWYAGRLIKSVSQQLYGWNGSSWSKDFTGSKDIPDSTETALVNGLNINFENAVGFPANQQFISGENLMFVTGPGRIKTNLQTMNTKSYFYLGDMTKIVERNVTVPGIPPYMYHLPEADLVDFKMLETDSNFTTLVEDPSLTVYTQVASSPSSKQYTVNQSLAFTVSDLVNNILAVTQDLSIMHGKRIRLFTTSSVPTPLVSYNNYWIIYVDSTHVKLAYSEADALANVPVDISTAGSPGSQFLVLEGLFIFNSGDSGQNIKLSCQYTERH